MNTQTQKIKGSRIAWSSYYNLLRTGLVAAVLILSLQMTLSAQQAKFTRPSWYFGGAVGANFNFYRGSTQQLTADLIAPVAFDNGMGAGLFLAPTVEYYSPDSRLGFMFMAGYDSRRGTYETMYSPCNCPRDLSVKLSYITIEPSLRFAPFKSPFYLFGGPRVAINMVKSFNYDAGPNPNYPEQVDEPAITGDLSDVKPLLISGQVGMGYDISLWNQRTATQMVLSPFISFQPYFGQSPRTIETWNVTTVRIGASLKIGKGKKIEQPVSLVDHTDHVPVKNETVDAETTAVVAPRDVLFTVNAPENVPVTRTAKEVFPLRNYVFFDLGSTEIPARYVTLSPAQVKTFREDQVQLFVPSNLTGRSERQMIVYYNVLNILGDRMVKNPSSKISLVGSSEQGAADGLRMAESVKKYLTTTFGISATRIATSGRDKPVLPSLQPGSNSDLDLLREGDRRVSIESASPELLMEFQNENCGLLKCVEISSVEVAPVESYVSFNVDKSTEYLKSWSLDIQDPNGNTKHFGPFRKDHVTIPGKDIMGDTEEGDFTVIMRGDAKDGTTVGKQTIVHMVQWKPTVLEQTTRYSVIFEFDDSKTLAMYDKYLTEVVVPKISPNSTVTIHGYTDVIGDKDYNDKLSLARANDVKSILEQGLAKAGTKNVKFAIYAFGEDIDLSPFDNSHPEGRFYNRTVIIDIVSPK